MKFSALDLLVCPACRSDFTLCVGEEDQGEVRGGLLTCGGCSMTYPIVRGVPRFVPTVDSAWSFAGPWRTGRTVQLDSKNGSGSAARTLHATSGWTAHDYSGRLVLDVGVGSGRFAEIVADAGGEVVGVDVTAAVDTAYDNIGRRPGVHVVQADLLQLPFRDQAFDKAYAIGVLHHMADPAAAFGRVVAVLKSGGEIAIHVHARYGHWHRIADVTRTVTTRLPLRLMLAASMAAVPLYYVYRIPAVGDLMQLALPISSRTDWRWRWLETFDWYTSRYHFAFLYPEVLRWFRDHGLERVEVFDEPIRMRATKPAVTARRRQSGSHRALAAV